MTLTDPDVIEHSTGISFSATFSLREKLGDGGTAGVHKAVRRDTGDEVAVKIVSRQQGMRWSRAVRIFEHEAEMLRLCAHSNVVSVFGLYQGPRDLALTLEMVPNGDMQQFLQRHGALAEHAVNAIILQLVRALAHVHSCGVLHRDVKLENLLVVHPGAAPHVKLCDFGHSTSDDCKKDGFTGTVGYAAPEVGGQNGRMPEWSAAADAWSAGVVMYALLANMPLQWSCDAPDFSHRMWFHVSTTAKLLIQALLAYRPEERCSLQHVQSVLAGSGEESKQPAIPRLKSGGLRALGSSNKSYSLLDISSLDLESRSVPRAKVELPTTPSLTSNDSMSSLSSLDLNTAAETPTQQQALSPPGGGGGGGLPTTTGPPGSSIPQQAAQQDTRMLPPPMMVVSYPVGAAGPSDDHLDLVMWPAEEGFMCEKISWWRGEYERRLHVDEASRRIATVDPMTGRATNVWEFDDILAVVDDEAQQQQQRRRALSTSPEPNEEGGGIFSLVLNPSRTAPPLCSLGGFLAQRLRFITKVPSERQILLERLRAASLGIALPEPTNSSLSPSYMATQLAPQAAAPAATAPAPSVSLLTPKVQGGRLSHSATQPAQKKLSPRTLRRAAQQQAAAAPVPEEPDQHTAPQHQQPPMMISGALGGLSKQSRASASCGCLTGLDSFPSGAESVNPSAGAGGGNVPRCTSGQEEQLRRMRERLNAIRFAQPRG